MKYKVTLRGKTYEVEVEHGAAILLDEYEAKAPAPAVAAAPAAPVAAAPAAAPAAPAGSGTPVAAPLPGVILTVCVSVGAKVKKGDKLFVIEAMKMENDVLAEQDGTVTAIAANKGATVQTGDPLLYLA